MYTRNINISQNRATRRELPEDRGGGRGVGEKNSRSKRTNRRDIRCRGVIREKRELVKFNREIHAGVWAED